MKHQAIFDAEVAATAACAAEGHVDAVQTLYLAESVIELIEAINTCTASKSAGEVTASIDRLADAIREVGHPTAEALSGIRNVLHQLNENYELMG